MFFCFCDCHMEEEAMAYKRPGKAGSSKRPGPARTRGPSDSRAPSGRRGGGRR